MHNKRPIIGIIARPNGDGKINCLEVVEAYRKVIIISGGNPIMILPPQLIDYNNFLPKEIENLTVKEKQMIITQIDLCDGILMPGGNNRYDYDRFITNYCLEKDVPILGICLGMQLLATHINRDTLVYTDSNYNHSNPELDEAHTVKLNKDSKLFNIIGIEEFYVNSRHKYKITETGDFLIVGYSSDGVVEAIEHKEKKFAIGVQWHPENLMNTIPSQKLFKAFIESCRENYGN